VDPRPRDDLEDDIRRPWDQGDFNEAVVVALQGYGPEVLRFFAALHRSEDDASEVFSIFCEEVLRSIASFAWRSSFRTWAYVLARRASAHYRREASRRAARHAPVPDSSATSAIQAKVRTETLSYLRTERRSRLVQLRDSLEPDDRALLVLRVDRKLAWNDLARVLHEDGTELDDAGLRREAARLRKRFQHVKTKLYEMARREGLVGSEE
jgi:RNA polymerase sigma-70 factor, ECF subfamily